MTDQINLNRRGRNRVGSLLSSRNRTTLRAGFTLTEVLIALALTALLLVGISKVFALTSTTIGTGQALSGVLRSQRAIQQVISSDFLGAGGNIGVSAQQGNGMIPISNGQDPSYASPYLQISNFRVATYRNASAMATDVTSPADQKTTINATQFATRSATIRSMDTTNDGADDVTIPLYWYGERNFRCDTLSFFTRGNFHSQTGTQIKPFGQQPKLIDDVSSNEAWVWYGQLRVFDSIAAPSGHELSSGANGCPGDWTTVQPEPNINNRFAEQFRLGRYQMLLVEPTDHDGKIVSTSPAGNLQNYNTLTVDGDPSQPVNFIARNWWDPTYKDLSPGATRPTLSPFELSLSVQLFNPATGVNAAVHLDPATGNEMFGSTNPFYRTPNCRTDLVGVGLRQARARALFVQQNDIDDPPNVPPTGSERAWWENVPSTWLDRYYLNPFPVKPFTAGNLSRRQQLLSDCTSQFIVEFAGDFISQNNDSTQPGYGTFRANGPDGVTDYILQNGVPTTRWYGMPRDVDGDGIIAGTGPARFTSPDVIPVRDVAGVTAPFEKSYPFTAPDYGKVVAEATTRANGKPLQGSPDDTSYVCVWGPLDFENTRVVQNPNNPGDTTKQITVRPVPQLIRIIVELRDTNGKLSEPVQQEMIYPVPLIK